MCLKGLTTSCFFCNKESSYLMGYTPGMSVHVRKIIKMRYFLWIDYYFHVFSMHRSIYLLVLFCFLLPLQNWSRIFLFDLILLWRTVMIIRCFQSITSLKLVSSKAHLGKESETSTGRVVVWDWKWRYHPHNSFDLFKVDITEREAFHVCPKTCASAAAISAWRHGVQTL